MISTIKFHNRLHVTKVKYTFRVPDIKIHIIEKDLEFNGNSLVLARLVIILFTSIILFLQGLNIHCTPRQKSE